MTNENQNYGVNNNSSYYNTGGNSNYSYTSLQSYGSSNNYTNNNEEYKIDPNKLYRKPTGNIALIVIGCYAWMIISYFLFFALIMGIIFEMAEPTYYY